MTDTDVVVVGAGIVGLAVAAELVRRDPARHVTVLDKESSPAQHQSGRNSGVVHAGVYYTPGSAKSRLVASGRELLERFCAEHSVPYEVCGKLIVATQHGELDRLDQLHQRATANGVPCRRVDAAGCRELEPHVEALAGLHVPSTAITDYSRVADALAEQLRASGVQLLLGQEVCTIRQLADGRGLLVGDAHGASLRTRRLVNCAGLHSDLVARAAGCSPGVSIVPFRGEYHQLSPERTGWVRSLVYPVPDPRWPFLGVHLTRMLDGEVHVGPNAVLALGREHYDGPARLGEATDTLRTAGLVRLAARYGRTGLAEWAAARSARLTLRAVRRLLPELEAGDLQPATAGIRAQALRPDGTLVDDFAFAESPHAVHVLNAPSPAATASLAIARHVVDRLG